MVKTRERVAAKTFVLDCSLTVAWFFEAWNESLRTSSRGFLGGGGGGGGAGPLEVANALLVGERRSRATEANVTTFLRLLAALPIALDDDTASRAWQQSLHLARSHRLPVYDAAYLELALRQGLPLATLDNRLAAAATLAGVPAYKPA